MEKTPLVILLWLLFLPLCLPAQGRKNKSFLQKDMFSFGGGLGGGVLVGHPLQDLYLNANAEYFLEKRVSAKIDAFFFLPDYNFEGQLQKNSSLLAGAAWHFPYKRWDSYMCFQTGLAFPGLSSGNTAIKVKTNAEPIMELSGGFCFYVGNNFHAFANAGYVHGYYYPEKPSSFMLDEVRFSAGIGFNVFFNRYAPYERRRPHF